MTTLLLRDLDTFPLFVGAEVDTVGLGVVVGCTEILMEWLLVYVSKVEGRPARICTESRGAMGMV